MVALLFLPILLTSFTNAGKLYNTPHFNSDFDFVTLYYETAIINRLPVSSLLSPSNSKVIGGIEATEGEFPWLVIK